LFSSLFFQKKKKIPPKKIQPHFLIWRACAANAQHKQNVFVIIFAEKAKNYAKKFHLFRSQKSSFLTLTFASAGIGARSRHAVTVLLPNVSFKQCSRLFYQKEKTSLGL